MADILDTFIDDNNLNMIYKDNLYEQTIPDDIKKLVSVESVGKYHLIPLCKDGSTLIVVTDNDQVFKNLGFFENLIGMPLKPLFAETENLRLGMNKHYNVSYFQPRGIDESISSSVEIDLTPLRRLVKDMLQDAANDDASDIHILPHSFGVYVFFRINGQLIDVSDVYHFDRSEALNLINVIKQLDTSRQADPSRTFMPDNGSFYIQRGDIKIAIRMATIPIGPDRNGMQKVNLRLLPQTSSRITLDQIGYQDNDLNAIKDVLFRSASGLFLNSGPVGSGKTTSLYAQIYYLLDSLNINQNVITIDNPIEIREERFTQVQVHRSKSEDTNLTEEQILAVGLRSDPDMFLYNEIRTSHDATVAIEASTTGHRVFSTVHASDCIKTIQRLLDLNVSKISLLSEIKLIISQRLVGLLCPDCKVPHTITEEERAVLSDEEYARLTAPGVVIYEQAPFTPGIRTCPNKKCTYGLIGRTAVAEYVIFDNDIRDTLLTNHTFHDIEVALEKHKYVPMWEKGLDLVLSGNIALKELISVIGKEL